MKCKGICYRFAAKKPLGGLRFASGQRPCSICGIFVDSKVSGFIRCPCCNNKLRLTSRNAKSRKNRFNLCDSGIIKKTGILLNSIQNSICENDEVLTAKLVLNK